MNYPTDEQFEAARTAPYPPYAMPGSQELYLCAIREERRRQDEKWGQQDHTDLGWLAILMEEVGEAAEAICHKDVDPVTEPDPMSDPEGALEREVVQCAAVCVAWLESRFRQREQKRGDS